MTFGTVQIVSVTIDHNRFLDGHFHSKDFAPIRYSVGQLSPIENVQNKLAPATLADRLKAASVGRAAARQSHNFRCLACTYQEVRDQELCSHRAQCEPHVPVRVQSHHRSIHIYPSRALHHRLPRLALHEAAIIGDSLHAGAPSRTSPSAPQMHAQRTSACAQLCKTRARWIPPGGACIYLFNIWRNSVSTTYIYSMVSGRKVLSLRVAISHI